MNLKNIIKKELTWALIWASPLLLPNSMHYLTTKVELENGFSKDFIERQWKEELPKERNPYISKVAEFVGRPGRNLAYLTTDQYKFPWKGYKRTVFE
ncbi:MAG: hypothetical protein Q8N99_00615 [Nanoarchaeota archaeon]|nr:hypothetical protein [Nanoarchaeota archaeon]